jgi:hypothetical protein
LNGIVRVLENHPNPIFLIRWLPSTALGSINAGNETSSQVPRSASLRLGSAIPGHQILDLTRMLAGPLSAQMLADLANGCASSG